MCPGVIKLLLVEDNVAEARLVQEALAETSGHPFTTRHAVRLGEALGMLEGTGFDAVLLDLSLPDSRGLETLSRMLLAAPSVPVVVLSGLHDEEVALQAVQAGAQDYLVKGQAGPDLLSRTLRYAIERKRAEEALRQAHDELERRVEARTADLQATNLRLQQEIDQRQRTEAVLRREHRFISAVLDTVGALVVVLDRRGVIAGINRECEQTTGYADAELRGRSLWDTFLFPEDIESTRRLYDRLGQEEPRCRHEQYWRTRSGGRRLIAWSTTVVSDSEDGAERIVATGIDITDRRAAEERAQKRLLEMAHVARLSTMGGMATEIAHELNQPLTAIAAYSNGCRSRLDENAPGTEALLEVLDAITRQALRAGEIIRRLRDFARKHDPRRTSVDLNELVREVVRLAEIEARWYAVRIDLSLQEPLPPVEADRILIEQVMLNLLRNAIEATAAGEPGQRRVVVETAVRAERIELSVSDSGPGLAPELIERVFEPFFSTKPKGMGMGLAISRSIVESHGGELRASNEARGGATFRVALPLGA